MAVRITSPTKSAHKSTMGVTDLSGSSGALIHSGTAQAGAATTITLASTASTTDDEYNGQWVFIRSGTGNGQARAITDYVGSTKVATVAAWTTNPDATSVYTVVEITPPTNVAQFTYDKTTFKAGGADRAAALLGARAREYTR